MIPDMALIPSVGEVRNVPNIQSAALHCIFCSMLSFVVVPQQKPIKGYR